MQHMGTVLIETDRLILRRFKLDDCEAVFKNWTNDSSVTKFLRWPAHDNLQTTEKVIKMWIDGYAENNFSSGQLYLKAIIMNPLARSVSWNKMKN